MPTTLPAATAVVLLLLPRRLLPRRAGRRGQGFGYDPQLSYIEKNYPGKVPGYNPWDDDELTICEFVIDGLPRRFRVKQ